MFIELTSIIPDEDGAPLKEIKITVNISSIRLIMSSKDVMLNGDDGAEKWRIWNKTFIKFTGGGCVWVKQPYQEIKQWLEKALNTRF